MTGDRHRDFQVGCNLHQYGGQHEDRILSTENGERKHGKEPGFVDAPGACPCCWRGDLLYSTLSVVHTIATATKGGL